MTNVPLVALTVPRFTRLKFRLPFPVIKPPTALDITRVLSATGAAAVPVPVFV